jgi:Fe-S-cluster containining protein
VEKLIKQEGYNYAFNPDACASCKGNCCIGESGYIWVSNQNIIDIAKHLKIDIDSFLTKYLTKIGYRYSIKEVSFEDGYRCIFFDTNKKQCGIYENRPIQCRTFPFWEYFKTNVREVENECPGICKL